MADNKLSGELVIKYIFKIKGSPDKEFVITLNKGSLEVVPTAKRPSYPKWANLGYYKCRNCSLDEKTSKNCPVAANIVEVVDFFGNYSSFENVQVVVETAERTYSKTTNLEEGIGSLVGIYMVTSGCPIMDKLKPMVRYHLPFGTLDETRYRALAMYLVAQYFRIKKGKSPDWDLAGLSKIYKDIRIVNKDFCERLCDASVKDASVNALVKLDCFAIHVSFLVDKKSIDEMEYLFNPYLRDE